MLFKMESAVRNGYTRVACTDVPCEWNQSYTKKVTPAPISNIRLFSNNTAKKRDFTPSIPSIGSDKKPVLNEDRYNEQIDFVKSLCTVTPKPVCLALFEETADRFVYKPKPTVLNDDVLPPHLDSVFKPEYALLNDVDLLDVCDNFVSTYKLSPDECSSIDKATQQQHNSLTWHQFRVGRITASKVYDVMRTSKTT